PARVFLTLRRGVIVHHRRSDPRSRLAPMRARLYLATTLLSATTAVAQFPERPFGTLRDQAALQQRWLEQRMTTVLPTLMRKHGIDLWVVPMREYNEDPVFTSIVSPTTFAARRRTIYVFYDPCATKAQPCTDQVERLALGG